ncbi:MAG: 4-hydroxy-3-methylbut-2-enyl diphosphate reductase [Clostridia bacterium]|nr:4-hydroxy-3-methylbut-2-enyl diphosphate reductase [Clostridia bacterium]
MELTVLESSGFCPGVRRATAEIERALSLPKRPRICVLGELIHNKPYNDSLRARGVETVGIGEAEEIARASDEGRETLLFIRAHGLPADEEALLSGLAAAHPRFAVRDMTCEFVRRIHRIAASETAEEGTVFLLLGTSGHPETEGILGHAKGEKYVFPDAEALRRLLEEKNFAGKRVIFAAQTTQNTAERKKSQKILEKDYTNAEIFDTICSVTEKRQAETEALAARSDGMIVIGGRESSNSRKLYDIAASRCPTTRWIETAAELRPEDFRGLSRIGIAAGASTPGGIIEEVVNKMEKEFNGENFAEMLEDSLKTLNTGDVVACTVTSVSAGELGVDLGAKVTGVIAKDQITDDPAFKLEENFKPGDTFEAFVIKVSDVEGMATLSKKRVDQMQHWGAIAEAKDTGAIFEGKITEAVKGGVIAVADGVRVFIPARHSGLPREADLSALVGQVKKFKIIDINASRRRAYGSIRAVEDEEKRAREKEVWENIEEGKHYVGRVKSLTSFGAFVDLGGVDGMVHNTELSWKRIRHPGEVVKVGDEIEVYVKAFDEEKHRISLGYKTPEMNNWYVFAAQYKVGDVIPVKIVSLMPFGAFAEIIDGVDGLIHISQIADHKIENSKDVLKVGDEVNVKITAIDEEKQKVSLSIRALLKDLPKEEAPAEEAAAEEAPAGETPAEAAPVEEAPIEEAPVEAAPAEEVPAEEKPEA